MVHSPTDDLFSPQQWEHWAMIFILVLGLVVGYGQAAAEDRRRAKHRRGQRYSSHGQARVRRSRPSPQEMAGIAPTLQRQPQAQNQPDSHHPVEQRSAASRSRHPALPQMQSRQRADKPRRSSRRTPHPRAPQKLPHHSSQLGLAPSSRRARPVGDSPRDRRPSS